MQNTEDRKMTTTRGKIQKYLGMTTDYSFTEKVILSMLYYIVNMLKEITEDTRGESATSSAHHPFYIAKDATKLS